MGAAASGKKCGGCVGEQGTVREDGDGAEQDANAIVPRHHPSKLEGRSDSYASVDTKAEGTTQELDREESRLSTQPVDSPPIQAADVHLSGGARAPRSSLASVDDPGAPRKSRMFGGETDQERLVSDDTADDGEGRRKSFHSVGLRKSVVGRRLAKCLRIVHLEVTVKGVFKLDTIEQIFGVHLGVIMQWPLPADQDVPTPAEDDGDWVPGWTPKYTITSEMQLWSEEVLYHIVTKPEDGSRWIRMEASHLVDIYEELEMHSFPNDLQDLTIEIRSKSTIDREVWVPPSGNNTPFARIETGTFHLQDFEIFKALPCTSSLVPREKMPDGPKVSCCVLTLKTRRKSGYYILNCNLFVFLTCTFSLLTWSIHPGDIAGRQDTDFMIILTMFSLIAGKSLMMPPLSYVTTLDIYMLLNLTCVILVTLSHIGVPLAVIGLADVGPLSKEPEFFPDEQRLIEIDTLSFWIFVGFMIFYNLVFTTYVYRRNASESRLYLQRSREQQDLDNADCCAFLTEHDLDDLPPAPSLPE